jgi:antitoxin HicB
MTEADTIEEAYEMIEDAKRAWLEAAIEEGIEIPLPETSQISP